MGRRPPEGFRVARQWHRSRVLLRGPLQCPCSLWWSWLGYSTAVCRAGQGPRCLSRPVSAWEGSTGGWMRETPSLFVGVYSVVGSRFGVNRIKRWSLHTAIAIPLLIFVSAKRCCDAAMLHSLNLGTATSELERIRAQSREERGEGRGMAWQGMAWHMDMGKSMSFSWRVSEKVSLFPLAREEYDPPPHQPTSDRRTVPGREDKRQETETETGTETQDLTARPKTCTRCKLARSCKRAHRETDLVRPLTATRYYHRYHRRQHHICTFHQSACRSGCSLNLGLSRPNS